MIPRALLAPCFLVAIHETRANVIGLQDRKHENASISDVSGPGGLGDEAYDVVDIGVVDDDFDHDFRQQLHGVLNPAINR